jgi:hypothetical protein
MITMQQTNGILLSSAFHSRAELHGTLEDVRNELKNIPCIRLTSTGTRIRCAILNHKNSNEAESILELAPNCITFRFFFKTPSAYESKRNFLRFVALLAYLKDLYTIKLSDLYCYIIDALRQEQVANAAPGSKALEDTELKRMRALSSVNASLSHALLCADELIKEKDTNTGLYKAFSKAIIDGLIRQNGKESLTTIDSLCSFGVDKILAEKILNLVFEKGNTKQG